MAIISFKYVMSMLFISICSYDVTGDIIEGKILTPFRKPLPLINKVTLTQKGYIQFLRYFTKIPPIEDFTFCIWLRSTNLTHSHPLVSYSLNEEERLLRAWVSPHGASVNLAIRENMIFSIETHLKENHWYHICQSWESNSGAWNFFLNGKLRGTGVYPTIQGIILPPHGDLVVGQEYTDFDKGLDDGIEGDIYGFNFLLEAAKVQEDFSSPDGYLDSPYVTINSKRRNFLVPPKQESQNLFNTDTQLNIENVRYFKTKGPLHETPNGELIPSPFVPSLQSEESNDAGKTEKTSDIGYIGESEQYGEAKHIVEDKYVGEAKHIGEAEHFSEEHIKETEVPAELGYFSGVRNPKGMFDYFKSLFGETPIKYVQVPVKSGMHRISIQRIGNGQHRPIRYRNQKVSNEPIGIGRIRNEERIGIERIRNGEHTRNGQIRNEQFIEQVGPETLHIDHKHIDHRQIDHKQIDYKQINHKQIDHNQLGSGAKQNSQAGKILRSTPGLMNFRDSNEDYSRLLTKQNNYMKAVIYPKLQNRRVYTPIKHVNDISDVRFKSLGIALVEITYHNCALGKGSPIEDEKVLISWTKTPVRVFGGAILKSVPAFCV